MEDLLQRGNGGVEGRDDVSEGELELALRGDELVEGGVEELTGGESEGDTGVSYLPSVEYHL